MTSPLGTTPPARTRPVSGWLGFAGILLFTLGLIHLIDGLAALFNDDYFAVTDEGLLVWNHTAWGWIWLILGVLQVLVGVGVMRGGAAARATGAVLTVLAMIGQIAYFAAFPLWSVVTIGMGVLVLYALITPPSDAVGA